jgi:hypothetical protein
LSKGKYNENFPILAEGFAREGLNDEQIAQKLGISTATYYNYQKKHLEFLEAIARGKAPVDTKVENALLKRCLGFEVRERHLETDGDGEIVKQTVKTKTFEPDVNAIKFWLVNRRPEKWSDKHKLEAEVENATEVAMAEKLIENMSFEEREKFLDKLLKGDF